MGVTRLIEGGQNKSDKLLVSAKAGAFYLIFVGFYNNYHNGVKAELAFILNLYMTS